jgi:hypothetical protein
MIAIAFASLAANLLLPARPRLTVIVVSKGGVNIYKVSSKSVSKKVLFGVCQFN